MVAVIAITLVNTNLYKKQWL